MSARPIVVVALGRATLSDVASLPTLTTFLAPFPRAVLPSLPEDEALHAFGTGKRRPDVQAALRKLVDEGKLLDDPTLDPISQRAEVEQGSFVDFMTQKERHRCRVHLFCRSSEGKGPARSLPIVELCAAFDAKRLPFVVHAILDGGDRSAQPFLDTLSQNLGDHGVLGTIIGARAFDTSASWDAALSAYRCIVREHDGPVADRFEHALSAAYDSGAVDESVPPTRIGDYDGVTGSLQAEFGAEAPRWEWRGADVGVFACASNAGLESLLSLLLRDGLPEDVAASVAIHGRAVHAFDERTLRLFSRAPSPVTPVVETACDTPSLFTLLAGAGRRAERIFQSSCHARATFAFEGDRATKDAGEERKTAIDAVTRATELARDGNADFMLVAIDFDPAPELDGALRALADAVTEKGGELFLATRDGAVVAGKDRGEDPLPATHEDVFAEIADACGLDPRDPQPTAGGARRLRRRR